MNPYRQFDREQWVYEFVVHGILSKRQAEVFVRGIQGEGLARTAGALGTDRQAVKTAYWNACTLAKAHQDTYLLMLGPLEFHRNANEYPVVKERALWALDPPDDIEQTYFEPMQQQEAASEG